MIIMMTIISQQSAFIKYDYEFVQILTTQSKFSKGYLSLLATSGLVGFQVQV